MKPPNAIDNLREEKLCMGQFTFQPIMPTTVSSLTIYKTSIWLPIAMAAVTMKKSSMPASLT